MCNSTANCNPLLITTSNAILPGVGTVISGIQDATGENVVTFSATPTFLLTYQVNTITLTQNVTSSTLGVGFPGQSTAMIICQDSVGGRTFTAPTNVRGWVAIGTTLNKCTTENLVYSANQSAWFVSGAVTNE
jgi:hypothetical protein